MWTSRLDLIQQYQQKFSFYFNFYISWHGLVTFTEEILNEKFNFFRVYAIRICKNMSMLYNTFKHKISFLLKSLEKYKSILSKFHAFRNKSIQAKVTCKDVFRTWSNIYNGTSLRIVNGF